MRMNEKELMIMRQQPAQWVALDEEFEKEVSVSGLILPSGHKVIEMNSISGLAFGLYRKQLQAQPFTMKGKWVWVPNPETIKTLQF